MRELRQEEEQNKPMAKAAIKRPLRCVCICEVRRAREAKKAQDLDDTKKHLDTASANPLAEVATLQVWGIHSFRKQLSKLKNDHVVFYSFVTGLWQAVS
jgi:hypothetical protein